MKKKTKEFLRLLMMTQEEAYAYVYNEVLKLPNVQIEASEGEYIYVRTTPNHKGKPLLTSHLDTVDDHRKSRVLPNIDVKDNMVYVKDKHSVLGADDKSGVWLMLQLLRDEEVSYDYDYLFCCDEEVGGIGSNVFAKEYEDMLQDYSCFISLDRANTNDVATYGYDNADLIGIFEELGFKEAYGSFTDCVNLSDVSNVACVNLSVGYYNEHTSKEIQDLTIMYNLLDILKSSKLRDKLVAKQYTADYNVYKHYNSYYAKGEQDPVLCDCCGQHLPLYSVSVEDEVYYVCEDCYPYYDRMY